MRRHYIPYRMAQTLTLSILFFIQILQAQEAAYPDTAWERLRDSDRHWSRRDLDDIQSHAESIGTEALFIVQSRAVVLDWGETSKNLHIFSARKSLLSGLYGIYVDRGIIDLASTLSDLGIDDHPPSLTDREKTATIRHLLKSRSGVYHKAAFETPGMEKNRPERGAYPPDEHWYYNNWDFNALTTIFEKATGQSVFRAFETHFAQPLGMQDFDIDLMQYHCEDESQHPATIYYLSARDLARIGLLYLQKGIWKGERILSEEWIDESTQPYSDLSILGGYGYCWWVSLKGEHYPFIKMPAGTFSARGTGEQTLLVIPAYDLVIVHLTEVTSPEDDIMHVVEFARLLKKILDARKS